METGLCLTEISLPVFLPGENAKHRSRRDTPFKGKKTQVFLPTDFRLIECGPTAMISGPSHKVRGQSHGIRGQRDRCQLNNAAIINQRQLLRSEC